MSLQSLLRHTHLFFYIRAKIFPSMEEFSQKSLFVELFVRKALSSLLKKKRNHNPFSEGQNAGGSPGHVCSSGILEYSSLFIFFFTIL